MGYMLLENGIGQVTLMTTWFFNDYHDALIYWAQVQYNKATNRGVTTAVQKDISWWIERYAGYGNLYEMKSGSRPKLVPNSKWRNELLAAMYKLGNINS